MFPLGYFYTFHHVRILHYIDLFCCCAAGAVVHPPLPLQLHPDTPNIISSSISIWLCHSTKLTRPSDIITISTDLSLLPRVDTDEDGRPQFLHSRNRCSVLFQTKTDLTCVRSKQPPAPHCTPLHPCGLWCKQSTLTHFLLDKTLLTFLRFVPAGQTR